MILHSIMATVSDNASNKIYTDLNSEMNFWEAHGHLYVSYYREWLSQLSRYLHLPLLNSLPLQPIQAWAWSCEPSGKSVDLDNPIYMGSIALNLVRYCITRADLLYSLGMHSMLNTSRPRQNGRHFPDDIFKSIFLNETAWIPIKISLKLVSKGQINNIPALVQIMAWRRPDDKPLSDPMVVNLLTRICVTRPQ